MAHQYEQRIVRVRAGSARYSSTSNLCNILDMCLAARAALGRRELRFWLVHALVHAATLANAARAANSPGHLIPPLLLRLVGLAGMRFAIRRTALWLAAAEVELVLRGVTDGPAAHAVVDRQHGGEVAVVKG